MRNLRRKVGNQKRKVGRTKISDFPRELIGEILSRVPLTSLRAVRSTCKTWNDSSKIQVLGQKAPRRNQFLEFVVVNQSVCSLRFDLQGVHNDDYVLAYHPSTKKIKIPNHQVKICEVFHCDGLLLCKLNYNDRKKILLWNPYLGQTRLIQTRTQARYLLGYDNNHCHKILKILYNYKGIEVYDFGSVSWRALVVNLNYYEPLYHHTALSLKGNTYFSELTNFKDSLVCFDFTTERFGPPLPLPYKLKPGSVALFWARDEKLAAVHYLYPTLEIWITTKIEPTEISWSSFLKLDMRLINDLPYNFMPDARSFFIDEEKKVVVFIDKSDQFHEARIIGKDGYLKSVTITRNWEEPSYWDLSRLVCSYNPSLVQLQFNPPEETIERVNQPADDMKERIVKQPGKGEK